MAKYWIGVAAKDHVMVGFQGGFCQLGHGKHRPVERLNPGDWLIYYAPRTKVEGGDKVQAFVALGQIQAGEPYQPEMAEGFSPWRRDVVYRDIQEVEIQPLLSQLSFIDDVRYWGIKFRRSLFEITPADFSRITQAMGVENL
ncbi:MAG: EVE domain-containing protein [Anaerolineae bacterium]|nr:EVE domain-containing protein [Anaerolineae bacterium]